jgi:alkylated DNA nucleotide flippase Atl1
MMLEEEGIRFDPSGRTDLQRYRWRPRASLG